MAIRLDGKQIAAEIRGNLKEKVDEIRKSISDFSPGLAIVQELFYNCCSHKMFDFHSEICLLMLVTSLGCW